MPKLVGAKAHALSGLIRDLPESNPSSQARVLQLMEASANIADQTQTKQGNRLFPKYYQTSRQNQGAAPSSQDSIAFDGMPEIGIKANDEIRPEELDPHFFCPNFIRPVPEAEFDPEMDDELNAEYDVSKDVSNLCNSQLFRQSTWCQACCPSLTGTSTWSKNSSTTPK